jgi:serine phosphatase RsbU (regulator of sigma subunit)
MLNRFFSYLLPAAQFSRPARTAWILLIILSPVAGLAGALVTLKMDPNTQIGFTIDRDEAIRAATRYAAEQSLNTDQWTSGARVEIANDRYFYFRLHHDEEAARARRLDPEAHIRVIFIAPGWQESLTVLLARDGQPLGYTLKPAGSVEVMDPGEQVARAQAVAAFRALQQRVGFSDPGPPELAEERSFNGVIRRYTWRLPAALPGLDQQITISALGDRLISQTTTTRIDPAYAKEHLINRQLLITLALVLYGITIFAISCYGLYRYVRRTWQKEVSHARSLLLGGVIAVTFIFISLQSEFHIFSPPVESNLTGVFWIILFGTALTFVVMGMAMGLAYGSSEGDVREAYPGKLTSLDALITGRLLSRNVARAVIIGIAFGGWVLFARSLALLPWANRPDAGQGLAEHFYSLFFGRSAWLLPLLNPPLGGIEVALAALLLPLSFLLRLRLRSHVWRLAALALLSMIIALGVFLEQPMPFVAGLLFAALRTAALVLLFFAFDLLTAITGIAMLPLSLFILYFISQPAASLQRAGFTAAGLALGFLAFEIFCLYRGREYEEDQVRPLYARHLAERLRLEAEVSAAREAQVRLLPQKLPEVAGLSLAAVCLPARVVGGDFYDLFPLDDRRLGVFVAEGGSHGLGAALTIAFAKGFLMPRLSACQTPAEIVCEMQEKLAPALEPDQEMAVAYAVIDTSERTLTYARAGRYPQIRISRDEDSGAAGEKGDGAGHHSRPEERVVNLATLPETAAGHHIREATVSLAPGDAVLIVTDGIAKTLQADNGMLIEEWAASVLSRVKTSSLASLQEALSKAMKKSAKRTKKVGIEDDLTAVFMRLNRNS